MSTAALRALVAERTITLGRTQSAWGGLSFFRYAEPTGPLVEHVNHLALCCVLQGSKEVTIDDRTWRYNPSTYLVLTRDVDFTAHITQASVETPFLSLVLQIERTVIRRVLADLTERRIVLLRTPAPLPGSEPDRPAFVWNFDDALADGIGRFIRATESSSDRDVLAPIYLHEVVYRLLRAERCSRLLDGSDSDRAHDPVALATRFVRANLSRSLTVGEIAAQVGMNPSTFAHVFRESTGLSPYNYVKRLRLDRALRLLTSGDPAVSDVARAVGYGSLSHFSSDFRRCYGTTPSEVLRYHQQVRPHVPHLS
jgi:AraC-like DNA-binding protein